MGFNNSPLITALKRDAETLPRSKVVRKPRSRRPLVSEPCLPERLPTSRFMQREAISLAPKELLRQKLKMSMEDTFQNEDIEQQDHLDDARQSLPSSPRSASSIRSLVRSMVSHRVGRTPSSSWEILQPYEVMKAVEEKDIIFLMEIRDKAFPLLLQSSGGETPLVHAIRTGNTDVAIVLLGAFSRWINYLEDADIRKPQTQSYLKTLRVGLKLAINEGLAKSQNDLIASFMQTLIMSEGDKWVYSQASTVSRALNAGPEGKPVRVAGEAVRRFATKELGKADLIASLEDYVANATADLLMFGAWANALQTIRGAAMPSYYFARDDRVYKAFTERLDTHSTDIKRSCSRRLKWQLQILRDGLEGRSVTYRRKIELLRSKLDEGEGT